MYKLQTWLRHFIASIGSPSSKSFLGYLFIYKSCETSWHCLIAHIVIGFVCLFTILGKVYKVESIQLYNLGEYGMSAYIATSYEDAWIQTKAVLII
jgi:hypothetical protein